MNPAAPVDGPKHSVRRGRMTVLAADEASALLDSIDISTVVGLRDRALIAIMTYSCARVSAAIGMRVEDYYTGAKRWRVRLHEKGGKRHEMPAHHNLETWMDAYLQAANIGDEVRSPPFRTAPDRTGQVTGDGMTRIDAWRMIRRRSLTAGIDVAVCLHTFRATGITAFLDNSGTLEKAQLMVAHESSRTTKLYDRTTDAITLDEVDRIAI